MTLSIARRHIELLLDEIEACFRAVRTAATKLGREDEVDAFVSRVSAIRALVQSGKSGFELNDDLDALETDCRAFVRTLQSPN